MTDPSGTDSRASPCSMKIGWLLGSGVGPVTAPPRDGENASGIELGIELEIELGIESVNEITGGAEDGLARCGGATGNGDNDDNDDDDDDDDDDDPGSSDPMRGRRKATAGFSCRDG
jgi:hypothetical protein